MTDKAPPLMAEEIALREAVIALALRYPSAVRVSVFDDELIAALRGQPGPSGGLGTLNALQVCAEALALAESELEKLRTQPAPSEGLDYTENDVQRMADALHEDCRLEWQAIAVADPERQVTQHFADAHYGQAHDLVRRLARQPAPSEGLRAERLARAMHASYERDPAVKRIGWNDLTSAEQAMWTRHAQNVAREYAALDTPRETSE